MPPRPARKALNAYHHGDLRDALVQAALHEVELGGPEAISISALAKILGVSQPAPYKHFADRETLLTAVTAEAFRQFSAMMRTAIEKPSKQSKLSRFAQLTLDFGLRRNGIYRLMFASRTMACAPKGSELHSAAMETFELLVEALEAPAVGLLRERSALKVWASLHGVVMLAEQGLLTGQVAHVSREELVEDIVEETKLALSVAIEAAGKAVDDGQGAGNWRSDNTGLYGGIVLGLSAIAALIVANSPLGPDYEALLRTTGEVRIGSIGLSKTVDHWINDGLMAVFFLLVGLEIKREAIEGPLSSAKQAALPVIAAFGGFVTPAAIFAAVNWGDAHALRGWAIPAATDIAFALGVCAMLGRKVPASLKIFLMALAIIDDLMAIIVIAIFYTADLSVTALALGGLGVAALAVLNLLDVRRPSFYLIAGLFTWVCVLKSGVHATLAGVAVGLAMPLTRRDGHSLLEDTEHALRPWVIFAIVPIFAFANAGVSLHGLTLSKLAEPIPLGIIAGLFIGKQIGVFGASLLAIRLGLAAMPEGTTAGKLYAMAILTGIGFTMSLFIGTLAFDDEAVLKQVRLGVLVASLLSGIVAALIFAVLSRSNEVPASR